MLKLSANCFALACAISLGFVSLVACSDATESPMNPGGTAGSAGQSSAAGSSGSASGGNTGAGSSAGGAAGSTAGTGGSSAGGDAGGAAGSGGSGGSSGSGGGGGGGGGGGMAPYNPCPTNGEPCKIMPLGDSITDGAGSSDNASYRSKLFHLALMNQQKITFVGSHKTGPDKVDNVDFPKDQEGHSGWTIDDSQGNANRQGLYPKMQEWLTNTPPHIVTLMIGTNDIDTNWQTDTAGDRLGLLLDRIHMYAPNALVVLAQMVPTTDDTENTRVQAYNAKMPALVKARADAGKHIIMVDMYGAFTKNANYKNDYMQDKLHPKDPGYVVMAQVWYDAIGMLFPK